MEATLLRYVPSRIIIVELTGSIVRIQTMATRLQYMALNHLALILSAFQA